jgi:streptogramin lyase
VGRDQRRHRRRQLRLVHPRRSCQRPALRRSTARLRARVGTATGCAIAGGAFHDTAKVSWPADFAGDYFYADLCSGWIRRFHPALGTTAAFATGISGPVDLQIGPNGDLYYLARGTGAVGRISTDWIFGDGFEAGS